MPNVLDPIQLPLSGMRLIEASAGTGKTYTIAALYVRLILGHCTEIQHRKQGLMPPDILVVTFTEAATKELRERIRDRLNQAAGYFRGLPSSQDDFLERLLTDFDKDEWSSCARRLELAANWMDEAAIYTIHGWCNRMLQQYAFASGQLFRQQVDNDNAVLIQEVVKDYWRTFYYAITDEQVLQIVYRIFKQPDDLLKLIRSFLDNSDPVAPCVAVNQDIATVLTAVDAPLLALKQVWQGNGWVDEMEALLHDAVDKKILPARSYRKDYVTGWMAKLRNWYSDPAASELDLAKGFTNLTPETLAHSTHGDHKPPSHPGFDAIRDLPSKLAALPDRKAELIKHALHWARDRYHQEKQRIATVTFDDMLVRLDQALQHEHGLALVELIRQQHPVAMIDEFQDTDPVQYRIISRLYAETADEQFACFMIGDPKQAIYSFRGADITTYLQAHSQIIHENHYTLDTNHRSTHELVKAVNQLFGHADTQQIKGVFQYRQGRENPLAFHPVKARGQEQQWRIRQQPGPVLTIWHQQSDVAIGLPEYREIMAECTANEISQLFVLAEQGNAGFYQKNPVEQTTPLKPKDIAILVRTGKEAKLMQTALSKRGIRSVYLSERDSVFATQEARDLLLWLTAFAEPRNEAKVRAAISSATIAWSYQALHALVLDEHSWEQQLERFLQYQQRWQQDGILTAIRQMIHDYQLHGRLQTDVEGERRLTNLLHLAELLQQISGKLDGEPALIRFLAEAITDNRQQSAEEHILRLESDANLIQIVTIHKSKGLEYSLVFLPFVCSFRQITSKDSYYRFHDSAQTLVIDWEKQEDHLALSDQERLQEDIRLLYVGLTRARYACWLGVAPVKIGNNKNCMLEKTALGILLNWQPKMAVAELADRLRQLKGECEQIEIRDVSLTPVAGSRRALDEDVSQKMFPAMQEPVRVAASPVVSDWWIASYSALPAQSFGYNAAADIPLEPETASDDKQTDEAEPNRESIPSAWGVHQLPRGADAGVLIHDLLEMSANIGFASIVGKPAQRRDAIALRCNTEPWVEYQSVVDSALEVWLDSPLLENGECRLRQLGRDSYQAEMEFLIGVDKVDTEQLDLLLSTHLFPDQPRPKLQPRQINGLLKGFIDLVFIHQQKYYLLDYKFNCLGTQDTDYTVAVMESAMLAKRYDLQLSLYLLALHRLLKNRLAQNYDYDQHVGGVLYWFLRGANSSSGGRLFSQPSRAFIEALDALFGAEGK